MSNFIAEQFTVKVHPALFEGGGAKKSEAKSEEVSMEVRLEVMCGLMILHGSLEVSCFGQSSFLFADNCIHDSSSRKQKSSEILLISLERS